MSKWIVVVLCFMSSALWAQDGKVVGTVRDTISGLPIPNVNVKMLGQVVAISDSMGFFQIAKLSEGRQKIEFSHVAYEPLKKEIVLIAGQVDTLQVGLAKMMLMANEAVVVAQRDVGDWVSDKESPISYTTLDVKQIEEIHTTQDLPELIQQVPGVWSSSAGLGEADLNVRGFSGDQVNFFINGIPMNEPENREMNWSDWSGLSSMVDAIQVIRGPMFVSQSSGAFGGAVQFKTRQGADAQKTRIRGSMGFFHTQGVVSGALQGQVANGTGLFVNQHATIHHVLTFEHHTGPIWQDRIRINMTFERKQGDSYIQGTTYDGWAFSLNATGQLKDHTLSLFLLGAPQTHDQATAMQDAELLQTLGREYNQVNHIWRYDHAFRPVMSLQDQWRISDKLAMQNGVFLSKGSREASRLINGVFDVGTGQVGFQTVSLFGSDYPAFGRHARYMYENFDVLMAGYTLPNAPGDPHMFNDFPFSGSGAHFLTQQQGHSWQNVVHHTHHQVGFSSQLDGQTHDLWQWSVGGNGQFWRGNRKAGAERVRIADLTNNGQATLVQDLLDVYDYDTQVSRVSGFARSRIAVLDRAKLYLGLQVASVTKQVTENPIAFFEFEESLATHQYGISRERSLMLRTSADQIDDLGQPKYVDADYKRHYWITSPWIGLTVSPYEEVDVYANYARSAAEPAVPDWYDPDGGPIINRTLGEDLVPERVQNMELGVRYDEPNLRLGVGYYRTLYKDKIESVVDALDRRQTQNAGRALFQGVEISGQRLWDQWEVSGAFSMAHNQWQTLDGQEIFGAPALEVVDKVVPFAPERTAHVKVDYQRERYGLGLRVNWWDRYFATFTNDYVDINGVTQSSKLPYFLDVGFQVSYQKPLTERTTFSVRLDCHNILNRNNNYQRAQLAVDHARNDALSGQLHWYVLQSPLFHMFLTAQFEF